MTDGGVINRNGPRGSKRTLYIWLGAGVLVGGVVFLRARHSTATAADTSGSAGTDGSGDYSADPGYSAGYGDYYPAQGVAGSYYDPTSDQYIGGAGGIGQVVTAPTTNAQWFQQTFAYLVAQGYDPLTTGAALGAYLAGKGLSNSQLAIVQAAIGAEGNPPTAVPAPHVNPPSGQTQHLAPAPAAHVASTSRTSVVLAWTAVHGASHYRVTRGNGLIVRDVTATRVTLARPRTGTEYVTVTAYKGLVAVSHSSARIAIPHR